jgi:hypothetical protein
MKTGAERLRGCGKVGNEIEDLGPGFVEEARLDPAWAFVGCHGRTYLPIFIS